MNILVRLEDYLKFVKKDETIFLDKKNGYKIWHQSKNIILNNFTPINEEIFDGTETKYNLSRNGDDLLITFQTRLKNKYRFDIIKEPNKKIYHLAFTLVDRDTSEYEMPTDLGESFEVFSKLAWILKDICLDVDEYCIGATGDKRKDSIYKYMMRFVKSWEKRNSDSYALGWALYFKI